MAQLFLSTRARPLFQQRPGQRKLQHSDTHCQRGERALAQRTHHRREQVHARRSANQLAATHGWRSRLQRRPARAGAPGELQRAAHAAFPPAAPSTAALTRRYPGAAKTTSMTRHARRHRRQRTTRGSRATTRRRLQRWERGSPLLPWHQPRRRRLTELTKRSAVAARRIGGRQRAPPQEPGRRDGEAEGGSSCRLPQRRAATRSGPS